MPEILTSAAVIALSTAGATTALWQYGSRSPGSHLFGSTLVAGDQPQEAALTYDDGPNGDLTLRLLDVLAERKTPACFFMIGNYVRQQPETVRRIVAEGHIAANHTMSHPILSWQSVARIREELAGCNAALEDATGSAVRYFRPPYGARRPAVLRIARELGLTPVLWNATGYDWNAISAGEIATNVVQDVAANRRRNHGSNILLHDGGQAGLAQPREATVQATAALIDRLTAKEMRFVSLDTWR